MTDTANATQVTITRLNEDQPTALHCHYQGEQNPQPCLIALDLEDGEMWARYNPEIGNGIPASVYHGRTLWWDIPCLTAAAANELMDDIKPLAERVLAGATIEWDGSNHVGHLNDDASAAQGEILATLEQANDFWAYQQVVEMDAADWFSEGDLPEGLTADTTDEELSEIAHEQEFEAEESQPGVHTVLIGADEVLTAKREEMRDEAREALEEIAAEFEAVRQRRDEQIRRLSGWGDSSRSIAERVDLSHTRVQQITRDA